MLVVTGACLVALGAAAALAGRLPADAVVRDFLLGLASPVVLKLMRVVNAAGDWRLLVPGTLLMFAVFPRARRRWWIWLGLMALAAMGPDVLKVAVGRPRPEDSSLGFPSGHATAAAAYFGAVLYLAGTLPARLRTLVRAVAVVVMLGVAIARIMLRAHWPSDTLGGIALGLALASGAALVAAASEPGDQ